MKIKPVPGRLIRDPDTGLAFTREQNVPDGHPFWLRAVASGDAAIVQAPPAKPRKEA
ncbi:MAG: DUF2635 domain-containing protein [Candidatus Accumulibacter sp.]|jgi:hypothetical protein|nr:DUF2635 domain-containing protein [Accumulibacter sp.]